MANALDAYLNYMATGGLGAELHRGAQLADFAKRRKLKAQELEMQRAQFEQTLPINRQNAGSRAQAAQTGAGKLALDQMVYKEAPDRLQQATDIRVAGHGRTRAQDLAKDPLALEQINDGQDRFTGADITTGQNQRQVDQEGEKAYAGARGRGDADIETKTILNRLGLLFSNNNTPEAMALKARIAAELEGLKQQGRAIINPNIIAGAQGPVGPRLDTAREEAQGRIDKLRPAPKAPVVTGGTGMSPAEAMAKARALRPDLRGKDLADYARSIASGQAWE